MRRVVFCLALGILTLPIFSQNNLIRFDQRSTVTWDDFQGPDETNTENMAKTRSGVKYSYNAMIRDGELELNFEVYSYFDKDRSWTIAEPDDEYLLAHEQLHFTIAELNARKFRKTLATYNYTDNFAEEVKALFKKSNEDRRAMQKKYDKESDHSRNPTEQARWERYVKEEMKKLSDFADPAVTYKE